MNSVTINGKDFQIDGYVFEGILGEGASSTVYAVTQKSSSQRFVAKVFHRFFSDEDAGFRFNRECRCLSALDHPNVIKIVNWGTCGPVPYMLLEYKGGKSLTQWITTRQARDWKNIVTVAAKISDGMAAIHKQNILHRDLKPENIIITPSMEPVIIDFGLASSELINTRQTENGVIVGTISYMDPTIITGRLNPSPATDTFSLGLVLYHMVAKIPPYPAEELSIGDLVKRVTTGNHRTLISINRHIPPALVEIVEHTIATAPDDRSITNCETLCNELKSLTDELLQSPINDSRTDPYPESYPESHPGKRSPKTGATSLRRNKQASSEQRTIESRILPPKRQSIGSKTNLPIRQSAKWRQLLVFLLIVAAGITGVTLCFKSATSTDDLVVLVNNNDWRKLGEEAISRGIFSLSEPPAPHLISSIGKLFGVKLLASDSPKRAIEIYDDLLSSQQFYKTQKERIAFELACTAAKSATNERKNQFKTIVARQIFYGTELSNTSLYKELFDSFSPLEQMLFRARAFLSLVNSGTLPFDSLEDGEKTLDLLEEYGKSRHIISPHIIGCFTDVTFVAKSQYCEKSGIQFSFPGLLNTSLNAAMQKKQQRTSARLGLLVARMSLIHYMLTHQQLLHHTNRGTKEASYRDSEYRLCYRFIKPWFEKPNDSDTSLPPVPADLIQRTDYPLLLGLGVDCRKTRQIKETFMAWNQHYSTIFRAKPQLEKACVSSLVLHVFEETPWARNALEHPEKYSSEIHEFLQTCQNQYTRSGLRSDFPGGTEFDFFLGVSLNFFVHARVMNHTPDILLKLLEHSKELPLYQQILANSLFEVLNYCERTSKDFIHKMVSELSQFYGTKAFPTELRTFLALEAATFSLPRMLQSQLTNTPLNKSLLTQAGRLAKINVAKNSYSAIHELTDELLGFILWTRLSWRKTIARKDGNLLHEYFDRFITSQKLNDDSSDIAWLLGHSFVYLEAKHVRYFIEHNLPKYKEDILSRLPKSGDILEAYISHTGLYRNSLDADKIANSPGMHLPLARTILKTLIESSTHTSPETFFRFTHAFFSAVSTQAHEETNDILIKMQNLWMAVGKHASKKERNWIRQFAAEKIIRLVQPASDGAALSKDASFRQSLSLTRIYINRQVKYGADTLVELSSLPPDELFESPLMLKVSAAKMYLQGKYYNESIRVLDSISVNALPPLTKAYATATKINSLLGLYSLAVDKKDKQERQRIKEKTAKLLSEYMTYPASDELFHHTVKNALTNDTFISFALSLQ